MPFNVTVVEEKAEESTVLMVVCLIIVLSVLSKRMLRKHEIQILSESFVTILVGVVVGGIIKAIAGETFTGAVRFDETTFTNYILPPIIFEAGFSLRHKGVVTNLPLILSLAVIGTLFTAVFIGVLTYEIARKFYTPLSDRPIWESMCFGAILSAIDPVAVLSVLGSMFRTRPPRIYYIIFGESVLNDAVAIVLYKVFLKFLTDGRSVDLESILGAILYFIYITIASVIIGWALAAFSAVILKYIKLTDRPEAELTILTLFGLGSYYISEAMGLSGIMSLFICGRTLCHYTWHNMSTVAQVSAPQLYHFAADVAETYVFSFLGLALWSFDHEWKFEFTICVLLVIFLSRLLTVFPLVGLFNLVSTQERVSMPAQIFMTLTGLRGAIAFGLALASRDNGDIVTGHQFVSTSLVVILVTVGVFGNFAGVIFRLLGLHVEAEQEAEKEGSDPATPQAPSRSIFRKCLNLEKRYVAPLLREPDHHQHHARRTADMHDVLNDLNSRYAVKTPQRTLIGVGVGASGLLPAGAGGSGSVEMPPCQSPAVPPSLCSDTLTLPAMSPAEATPAPRSGAAGGATPSSFSRPDVAVVVDAAGSPAAQPSDAANTLQPQRVQGGQEEEAPAAGREQQQQQQRAEGNPVTPPRIPPPPAGVQE